VTDTALSLITDALKELGVLETGESPEAQDAADCLRRMDRMIDGWALDSGTALVDMTLSAALVASQASYTVGPGGDFSGQRPPAILRAWVKSGTQDIPVRVLTEPEYDRIPVKSTTSTYPQAVFYDPQQTLGVLYPWPVATGTNVLYLRFRAYLSQFGALSTSAVLPPGYWDAIVLNLAVASSAFFGTVARQRAMELVKPAEDALYKVQRANVVRNLSPVASDYPSAARGMGGHSYNIETGEPN
jgi:hypothetical protein